MKALLAVVAMSAGCGHPRSAEALAPPPQVREPPLSEPLAQSQAKPLQTVSTSPVQLNRREPADEEETAPAPEGTYLVCDNGIRCLLAPCFNLTAQSTLGGPRIDLSGLDLTQLRIPPAKEGPTRSLVLQGNVQVTGRIRDIAGPRPRMSGRSLVVTKVGARVERGLRCPGR